MNRRATRSALASLLLLALGCHDSAAHAPGSESSSEGPPGLASDSSSSEPGATESTSDRVDESSSGDRDLADDMLPLGRSRFVVDVGVEGGHTLELHELVDGEPQPPLRLLPASPLAATFEVTPLGARDQLAVEVTYSATSRETLLVDWRTGEPTIESLGTATTSSGVYWDGHHALALVRGDDAFARFDLASLAPHEPVPVLADVPKGVAFDDGNPLLPVDATVAARGTLLGHELYLASLLDPTAPTAQPTAFAGTGQFAYGVQQLAGGHVAYLVGDAHQARPTELHVAPKQQGRWTTPLVASAPADPNGGFVSLVVRPGTDGFAYEAAGPDAASPRLLLLGGVEAGELAVPQRLREGSSGQLRFTDDGGQLLYATADAHALEAIALEGDVPSAARVLFDAGADEAHVRTIAQDGEWVLGELAHPGTTQASGLFRASLGDGGAEVLASDIDPVRTAFASDGRSVAFLLGGGGGYVTKVVDCRGAVAGPPVLAAIVEAPVIDDIGYSPDGAWLAMESSSGASIDAVTLVRADAPGDVVLALGGLVGPLAWLP